jgi:hypothetical protein
MRPLRYEDIYPKQAILPTRAEQAEREWGCDHADGDYLPLLQSLRHPNRPYCRQTIILKVDDNNYSGDSRVLYRSSEDMFGLLVFGWGSCSACDALQACTTQEDVEELANQLEQQIKWLPRAKMLEYLTDKDWAGEFHWGEETKRFVAAATALLSNHDTETARLPYRDAMQTKQLCNAADVLREAIGYSSSQASTECTPQDMVDLSGMVAATMSHYRALVSETEIARNALCTILEVKPLPTLSELVELVRRRKKDGEL